MLKKNTDDLMQELKEGADLNKYLKDNEDQFICTTVSDCLRKLFSEKHIIKAQAFKRAEMQDIYAHQILSGVRKPSREKLIALCIGMKLSLEETQKTLKTCGFAVLYPKIKRESIIISGIRLEKSVFEINQMLYEYNEQTL